MGIFGRRDPDPPDGPELALGRGELGRGERVLASCVDQATRQTLVATTQRLCVLGADAERLDRPWHLVDTGSYDNEADVLSVTWVDRAPALALRPGGHKPFLQAFRERVQASVVVAESLELGAGRSARLVIRKDLAADRLLDQVILGRGVRLDDPGVRRRVSDARRALREQVGLA